MPVILPPGLASDAAKPASDHVLGHDNERNGLGFLLKLLRNEIACDHDCIWCCFDDRRHRCGGLLVIEPKTAGHEFEVFALDKALLAQFIKEGHRRRLVPAGGNHDSEAIDAARLLRRAPNGHASDAPPTRLMNSRRFIAAPARQKWHRINRRKWLGRGRAQGGRMSALGHKRTLCRSDRGLLRQAM